MMTLNWTKCQGEVWCKLNTLNLAHAHFNNLHGVYIIWHGGTKPETVYVGKGLIRDRLQQHRSDERIQKYAPLVLFVTWAQVSPGDSEGVEVFLATRLNPLVGEQYPARVPIEVNSPW